MKPLPEIMAALSATVARNRRAAIEQQEFPDVGYTSCLHLVKDVAALL